MPLQSEDVKRAVYRFCTQNKAVSVSECALGNSGTCGRADVVGLKIPSYYRFMSEDGAAKFPWVVEFEVKTTASDLKNDVLKWKWNHWRLKLPCTHFYYAVPRELEDIAMEVSDDLIQLLKGRESVSGKTIKAPGASKMSPKAQIGVLVVDDEFRFEIVRKAVRFQSYAPVETVNKIIGRSFWELHNLRGVTSNPALGSRIETVETGQVWQLTPWHHRRRSGVFDPPKVRVLSVSEDRVEVENLVSGRKSKSKISGFCTRYRLVKGPRSQHGKS